jgi:hypothetical protein
MRGHYPVSYVRVTNYVIVGLHATITHYKTHAFVGYNSSHNLVV